MPYKDREKQLEYMRNYQDFMKDKLRLLENHNFKLKNLISETNLKLAAAKSEERIKILEDFALFVEKLHQVYDGKVEQLKQRHGVEKKTKLVIKV